MKRNALFLTLLLALLLLTACHTDNDPWPANDQLISPTATSVPTEQPPAVLTPVPTAEPTAVTTPVSTAEPTEIPGGDAAPGING